MKDLILNKTEQPKQVPAFKFKFNPKNFNQLFFDLKEAYEANDEKGKQKYRYFINWGGFGSGKSVSQAEIETYFCMNIPNTTTLACREFATSLDGSVYKEIYEVVKKWKLVENKIVIINETKKQFKFVNGSVIKCIGLDDQSKLKSVGHISRVWLEEADKISYELFDQLDSRLRGLNKRLFITLTFNPEDEDLWLKEVFFDFPEKYNKDKNSVFFHTTCEDNKFIDQDYKDNLKAKKDYDYNAYRVRYLGQWVTLKKGGEIYSHFTPEKHVKDIEYNPNETLLLSFDENVSPYITLIIAQANIENKEVRIIDEICLKQQQLDSVMSEFLSRYGSHQAGIIITGDSTSQKRNVLGDSFYPIIRTKLQHLNAELRVGSYNQSVFNRTNWVNENIFFKGLIKISISHKCKELIRDLENVRRGADGNKDKKRITRDNMSYQAYGHNTDCTEYLLLMLFNNEFTKYCNGGEYKIIAKRNPKIGDRY